MKNFNVKLAKILLIILATHPFEEVFYLSLTDRDTVRKQYGHLPKGLASPEHYNLSSQILNTISDNGDYYMDDTDLVGGNGTTVMEITDQTWEQVVKAL